nr:7953_t:CDS:2 [Entrophospora candida]
MKNSFPNIIRKPLKKIFTKNSSNETLNDNGDINCLIKIEQERFSYIEVILDEDEDGENYHYYDDNTMSLFGNKSLANNNNINDDDDSIEDDVTTCYYPNEIIDDYEANENEDEIFPYNDKKKYGYRSWVLSFINKI